MPKSVDPARPAQAGLRCLLSGTDRCDENGGIRRCAPAPALRSKKGQDVPIWERERILPLRAPFATIIWDFIHRGIPLGNEGSLTADEAYALTAYLLFLNKVIPEDQVLDKHSLPKVKMPIGDDYARLPEWSPGRRGCRVIPTSPSVQSVLTSILESGYSGN
jgi:hypothetical protein